MIKMSSRSFTQTLSQSRHWSMIIKDLLLHNSQSGYHALLVYVKPSCAIIAITARPQLGLCLICT